MAHRVLWGSNLCLNCLMSDLFATYLDLDAGTKPSVLEEKVTPRLQSIESKAFAEGAGIYGQR